MTDTSIQIMYLMPQYFQGFQKMARKWVVFKPLQRPLLTTFPLHHLFVPPGYKETDLNFTEYAYYTQVCTLILHEK